MRVEDIAHPLQMRIGRRHLMHHLHASILYGLIFGGRYIGLMGSLASALDAFQAVRQMKHQGLSRAVAR
ncbi:hypothetical protein [Cupriavidus plantarum]|uniref:hypothetical protein n=1 Tax=Cupriavidus plantarum TaxID=942865 RepID=UPI00339D40D2